MPERAVRGHNYDVVAELVAARVKATAGRISAKRLLPAARVAGGLLRGLGGVSGTVLADRVGCLKAPWSPTSWCQPQSTCCSPPLQVPARFLLGLRCRRPATR